MTIEVQEKSDVAEVTSETVESKVVGEITTVEPESDTSADESESEQI